ncbi:MAG: hypothetical protein U0414_04640 [Polyangiaceae bacterium]
MRRIGGGLLSALLATACAAGSDVPPTGSSTSATSSTHASSTSATSSGSATTSSGAGGMGGSGSASSTTASASTSSSSSAATGGAGGCGAAYEHTITIDGIDDFAALEKPATSSVDYTARVTWDATYLYVGMNGPDVSSNSATRWLLVYLSGTGGTTTGVAYNNQAPTLPFGAKWHVRWRTNNTFTNALSFDGTSWVDAGWDFAGDVFQSGNFVELRIPRADVGDPGTVDVHVSMINEVSGGEFTFAGLPKTSFTDGFDPNYAHFFRYDFAACDPPSAYPTL